MKTVKLLLATAAGLALAGAVTTSALAARLGVTKQGGARLPCGFPRQRPGRTARAPTWRAHPRPQRCRGRPMRSRGHGW